jgi:2-dehydropantoate 2-reductase
MKILIYGAGVIGSYLTHVLCSSGNDVSVLARGSRREELEANGLVIQHYRQKKTTVDHPRIVERLNPVEEYDAVFAVMQYQQLWPILDELAACESPLVIFVGNNPSASEMYTYIRAHMTAPKTILFGFQATGGRREDGKIICVRFGDAGLKCGFLHGEPDETTKAKLSQMFIGTKYTVSSYSDMDAWYKGHLAMILPVGYLCYRHDCDLKKVTGRQLKQAMTAIREGYGLLSELGYPILPEGTEAYFKHGPKGAFMYGMLRIMAATDLGRLAASDHCRNAVTEMRELNKAFDALRAKKPDFAMPVWEQLERYMPIEKTNEAGGYAV